MLRFKDETGNCFYATPSEAAKRLGVQMADIYLECQIAERHGITDLAAVPGMTVEKVKYPKSYIVDEGE